MWKAWIENGNIFVAPDQSVAPPDAIEVPEGTTPQDLKIVDGRLTLKTDEEKLQELKKQKLQELRVKTAKLLEETDFVVIKLHSLRLEGADEETIHAEENKYARILEERRRIREWNAFMKEAILQTKTIEELQKLQLEYGGMQQ